MRFGNDGWTLDLDGSSPRVSRADARDLHQLAGQPDRLDGDRSTNSRAILAFARARGLWIIADEVYHRFYYAGAAVALLLRRRRADDDRILFVNTFSKNWAMTGWRIGWLSAPPALGQVIENLIQYSTSGVAAFMQRARDRRPRRGRRLRPPSGRARPHRPRHRLPGLAATGRVRFAEPDGAFYLFFAVDGETDTRQLGLRLVDEANVGMAPGDAFGEAGRGFMRLCFARERRADAKRRPAAWSTGSAGDEAASRTRYRHGRR